MSADYIGQEVSEHEADMWMCLSAADYRKWQAEGKPRRVCLDCQENIKYPNKNCPKCGKECANIISNPS